MSMTRRDVLLLGSAIVYASAAALPVLKVGAALPDPPFELEEGGKPIGFDIALMR
jgi:ABC-type amino acid transport substrate-binding protein